MPLLARALRAYLRSELRGSTRLTSTLARRVGSLHHVPVVFGSTVVYIDLRDPLGQFFLQGSPWSTSPLEPDEQAIMRRVVRSGDVVFDIGAYIGLHTAHLAHLVGGNGVVHVFEPNPRRHELLAHTAAAYGNVTLHRFGLSDRGGGVELFVPVSDEATSSLCDWTEGEYGAVERISCEVKPLDSLLAPGLLPRPDFIKCDVEGAERRVFEGARLLLDRADAPVVMYEANARSARAFSESMSAATEWLAALAQPGYSFFHVQPRGTLVPVPPTLTAAHDHFNLLAVPAARRGAIRLS